VSLAALIDTNMKVTLFQRLTSSMPMHPLPIVLNRGVPVTLNSDDPSVFGAKGLSYDYFQVLVSSETTGLITLAQMARDSIEVRQWRSAQRQSQTVFNNARFSLQFSTLEDTEKKRALSLWEKRWYEFVEGLVKEFGDCRE